MKAFSCTTITLVFLVLCLSLCRCLPVNSSQQDKVTEPVENIALDGSDKEATKSNSLGSVVSSLLSSLLRQTLYNRMENLLLDPGRKSFEKQRIVEAAVENYQQQPMATAEEDKETVAAAAAGDGEGQYPRDFSKLAGYWIRATPGPQVLASVKDSGNSGGGGSGSSASPLQNDAEVNFQTEEYNITDLFTTTTTTAAKESNN